MAASFDRAARSAPTKPCVVLARSSSFTSSAIGMPRVCTWSIWSRPAASGTPISISRSNRPGLRRAGSIPSGRLVAAITTTCPRASRPSINESSWATTRRSTSPVTSLRFGAIASISSIKMIAGALSDPSLKSSRRCCSLSP